MYIKISKTLSGIEEDYERKKLVKDAKIVLKKKKKKSMVVNITKNLSENEKQKPVEYKKNKLQNDKKCLIINFCFKNQF